MVDVVARLLSLGMLSGPHQKTDMDREAGPRDNAAFKSAIDIVTRKICSDVFNS